MSSESVKVLNFWPSMFGMRVLYALNLKGISYEYQEEDLLISKSEELLKSNPVYKKIPVLLHNGKAVSESLIIVDYIDNAWPDVHKLLPDDPYGKAVARFWADFGDKKVYDAGYRLLRSKGEDLEKAVEDMKWCFKTIDEALAQVGEGKTFFGGDKMNFADVGLAPFVRWFKAYEIIGGFKLPGAGECPYIHKWMEALDKEAAVNKSTPSLESVVELAHAIRKRLGISM